MISNTAELMDRGMRCLVEKLGLIEAEQFIATMKRENFDYTKWQRSFFDAKTPEEISTEATAYAKEHPFKGKAEHI